MWYAEVLIKTYNEGDRTFYDAINHGKRRTRNAPLDTPYANKKLQKNFQRHRRKFNGIEKG
jgi:hypothetical protein